MRNLLGLTVVVAALAAAPGCTKQDDFSDVNLDKLLEGPYFNLEFGRSTLFQTENSVTSRAGTAAADGRGLIGFGISVGQPTPPPFTAYKANAGQQFNFATSRPGYALPNGSFFAVADLDRLDDLRVGMSLFSRFGSGMTVDRLVDAGIRGQYHAVMLRFNQPGVITGIGEATIEKTSDTTADWTATHLLSADRRIEVRKGKFSLAPDGAVAVEDSVAKRTYLGFADETGDYLIWLDADSSGQQVFRMDILIRKGNDLGAWSLNGRYNLGGFLEARRGGVDTVYGKIEFDGNGNYFAAKFRNSFGITTLLDPSVTPPPPRRFPVSIPPGLSESLRRALLLLVDELIRQVPEASFRYEISADGIVRFEAPLSTVGFITRDSNRRILILPWVIEADPIGFVLAMRRGMAKT